MPIHDVGYREWIDNKISRWSRCLIIALTGIRITLKSVWVKRVTMACWLPIFYWGVGFLVFERLNDDRLLGRMDGVPQVESPGTPALADALSRELEKQRREQIRQRTVDELRKNFKAFPSIDRLVDGLQQSDPGQVRHTFWSWMLMTYFRYPQAAGLVFLLGFVTPSLISKDVRSRALVLYFSRPIGRLEYLLGKFLVPTGFLMAITTAPALVLYVLGVFLSPSFEVVWWTWDIPLRIFLATAIVVLPTVSLALMLSAMTQESRFAAFAWFAFWALGHGAWFAIQIAAISQTGVNDELSSSLQGYSRISLYNVLGEAQSWVFGFSSFSESATSLLILAILTIGCQIVLVRRLSTLR